MWVETAQSFALIIYVEGSAKPQPPESLLHETGVESEMNPYKFFTMTALESVTYGVCMRECAIYTVKNFFLRGKKTKTTQNQRFSLANTNFTLKK